MCSITRRSKSHAYPLFFMARAVDALRKGCILLEVCRNRGERVLHIYYQSYKGSWHTLKSSVLNTGKLCSQRTFLFRSELHSYQNPQFVEARSCRQTHIYLHE